MNILENKLRNNKRILNHAELIEEKTKKISPETPLVEFHPTNKCNLNCKHCTYEDKGDLTYPFKNLKFLKSLKPQGIVIAGGGEPTLYEDSGKGFSDMIIRLRSLLYQTRFGLITNGTIIPPGHWMEELSWIRISLDEIKDENFQRNRGGELKKVMKNIFLYLKSPIPHVGVGFLVHNENIRKVVECSRFIYESVIKELGKEYLKKINIQFRKCCKIDSCNCPSKVYMNRDDACSTRSKNWKEAIIANKEKIQSLSGPFREFLEDRTNIKNIEKDHRLTKFKNCYLSLARVIIMSSGELHPCVIRASQGLKSIGNIQDTYPEEIAGLQKRFFQMENCNMRDCCRIDSSKNAIVEKHLLEEKEKPLIADPFF